MLKIFFGDIKDTIYNTSQYFDNTYLDGWITDEFAKKIIKNIDKAEVLGPQAIDSKYLGVVPATSLSGGTKTLLLIYNEPTKVFNASTCGDNCAKWILKIAKKLDVDITINLYHIMNFGDEKFEIEILNSHTIVHNMEEYIVEAINALNVGDN